MNPNDDRKSISSREELITDEIMSINTTADHKLLDTIEHLDNLNDTRAPANVGSKKNLQNLKQGKINGTGATKEKIFMLTKQFEPKEMLAFSKLRTLNQKELISSLETNDKLGIVIKDQLKVAMIDMDKYQMLVDTVQEHYRLLEWMDEQDLSQSFNLHRRLEQEEWEEVPSGMSFLEWAGIQSKG